MKKVFLSALVLGALVFGTTSCSKDDDTKTPTETNDDKGGDDNGGEETPKTAKGTINFKFNGADMSYSKLVVQENPNDKESHVITATKTSNDVVYGVNIVIKKAKTGKDALETFNFTVGGSEVYSSMLGGISSDVTVNSATEIKATFSGELKSSDGSKTGKFTDGVVDVKFE